MPESARSQNDFLLQQALLMAWMPPPGGIAMCQYDACEAGTRPNQLSTWRRLAKQGQPVLPPAELGEPVFAPLVTCDPTETTEPSDGKLQQVIRIVKGTSWIQLSPNTPAGRIAAIVHALEAPICCCRPKGSASWRRTSR